jgi:DNA-binding CsgD family transcriptional regulator
VVATFLEGHAIQLSRRESQLVALVSSGLRNREIADTLGISEGTVKVYLSRLFLKVGAKDRFELALYGTRNLSPTAPPEEPSGFALKSIFVPKGSKSPGRGFSDAAAGPARDR